MSKPSWKDRKAKLADRTKKSAANREGKTNSILNMSALGDMEVRWADKVKKGRDVNKFDFLPFTISEPWYSELRTPSGERVSATVGDVDYKLEYAIHRNVGPEKARVLCLLETFGRACPICEERAMLLENQEDDPEGKLAAALKPTWRVLYNIVDLSSGDDVRLWEYSYHMFEKSLLNEVHNGDSGLQFFWDIDTDGKTVEWRGKERVFSGNKFIECDRVDFVNREPYPESILDEVYPLDKLLVIPTNEQVARLLLGMEKPDTSDVKQTEKEPEPEKQSRSRYTKKEEPKEDKESNDDGCPQGLKFGIDFDSDDKCQKCSDDDYNACQNAHASKPEPEPELEPEPEKQPESTNRRRRR